MNASDIPDAELVERIARLERELYPLKAERERRRLRKTRPVDVPVFVGLTPRRFARLAAPSSVRDLPPDPFEAMLFGSVK
jgi:hypothetical protein